MGLTLFPQWPPPPLSPLPFSLFVLFFPSFPHFWPSPHCALPFLGPKSAILWRLYIWKSRVLGASFNNVPKTSSSKQSSSSFKRLGEAPLNLGALYVPLSIDPSQSRDSGWSSNSVSELSIRSSRVSLYLLGIAAISDFPSHSQPPAWILVSERLWQSYFDAKRGFWPMFSPDKHTPLWNRLLVLVI